ncbi:alpha-(1,3)-fucosyltransferase 7-like [Zootermopsis nevadensis]|uniref:Fucosyltransferase n=1 Tax=Zootermopsis nevadensis TaxID=136037 RepID=A0A067R6X2_ZOONE|nr:alpha-(1,3)-fucosyltransferase 7-like [Zootermopsis nevadensis]KDR19067.1 Glycoprotein 3-alpha-L-fucosyltransferase A [Zootermopsis nevadensis]
MGNESQSLLNLKFRGRKRWRRLLTVVVFVLFVACLLRSQIISGDIYYVMETVQNDYDTLDEVMQTVAPNWRGLRQKDTQNMSALGRRLFLGDVSGSPQYDRNFTILVWKHGPNIEKRLIMRFGNRRWDPFRECSVSNCRLTYDSSELNTADAVLFHLHRTPDRKSLPDPKGPRPANQRWVFLTDENPFHTFTLGSASTRMKDYNGLFNWSMTYRMDSDVPVPSGRTLPLTSAENKRRRKAKAKAKAKTKLAAIMVSNCGGRNKRWEYVKELRKHMPVDVYGACGNLRCEGHFAKDCPGLNDYKFYLAFENGNCREYITEKAWWNAYHKGAVPVIMGAPPQDCARLLPPKSYIHVSDFASPASLARYLLYLNASSEYRNFFNWKNNFEVVNEHGYFQSPVYHYCRLCEALNYNDPAPKVYSKLEDYWNSDRDCNGPVI